ncbi:MAG: hypothetical protein ABI321_08150 [Polyangia bacterium]
MTRRVTAALAIVSYLLAIVVVPELHRLHHARYGADHEHTASGTIYTHEETSADLGSHHAEFDATLADLGLAEVATAGTLTVDCAYTELTLATCDAAATTTHARTFGDDLLARTHHHHAPADPHHGAGSLEHLSALLIASAPLYLVPPVQPFVLLEVVVGHETPAFALRTTCDARGPPRAI